MPIKSFGKNRSMFSANTYCSLLGHASGFTSLRISAESEMIKKV